MASPPGSSSSSGACQEEKKAARAVLPPSPSTERFTDRSTSDLDPDSDSDRDSDSDNGEANQAYRVIWDSFCGLPTQDAYPTFSLSDDAYARLSHKISRHNGLRSYFDESLRKDWNAETGVLILRLMPTPIHEYFQEFLIDGIKKELDRVVCEYPALQTFRDKIISGGHTNVGNSIEFTKSPDGQFSYDGIAYPQVVIEIAYSEGERKAKDKSHEYFTEMPGKISSVLLFDIHYAPRKERRAQDHSHCASLSLWVSEKVEGVVTVRRTVNTATFRDKGQPLPGELVLPLELFIPPRDRDKLPVRDIELHLGYEALSEFIDRAEQRQSLADATPPPTSPVEKIKFIDEHGAIVSETTNVPGAKRRRGNPQLDVARRTRSMSRPRRSPRLRSAGDTRGT
ncbi:hypothetical protein F4802DRAFT_592418 [Xylaria palmicola]|nr:hypothetical protein F4802DRAFT_592418 [Xylaria palmicola]